MKPWVPEPLTEADVNRMFAAQKRGVLDIEAEWKSRRPLEMKIVEGDPGPPWLWAVLGVGIGIAFIAFIALGGIEMLVSGVFLGG